MSENPPPEEGPSSLILGGEVVEGVGALTSEVFMRSGLPLDTKYSQVMLVIMDDKYRSLEISCASSTYDILYTVHGGSSGLTGKLLTFVRGDGSGLRTLSHLGHDTPNEATEDLIRILPDFKGATATITINAPKAQ